MASDRKCLECGYINEPRAAFCGNCGSPLRRPRPQMVPPSTLPEEIGPVVRQGDKSGGNPSPEQSGPQSPRECPSCHCPAQDDDMFCRQCGASLVLRTLYCKRCGDPVDADETFCNRCGLPLR
jgi:membrane protease subunit (stomatin/prohibitin family)